MQFLTDFFLEVFQHASGGDVQRTDADDASSGNVDLAADSADREALAFSSANAS
ncbi:MAG: hypothetical protein ABR555_09670 [Pyrinomonadaceae bacterium]